MIIPPTMTRFSVHRRNYLLVRDGKLHGLYVVADGGALTTIAEGDFTVVKPALFALFTQNNDSGTPTAPVGVHPSAAPPSESIPSSVVDSPPSAVIPHPSSLIPPLPPRSLLYCCAISGTGPATYARRRDLHNAGYAHEGHDHSRWTKHAVATADVPQERARAESWALTFTATEEAIS